MAIPLEHLDWSLVRAFVAVAEKGSLSGAAKALGRSQPTVGRQVQALEEALGVALFSRQRRGMALSRAGQSLLPHAREMAEAAARLALVAAGQEETLDGTVRLTASEVFAHEILPGVLRRIRDEEPGVEIELVASNESENLLFREADIAIRMYRPSQLEVVTRHIGDVPLAIFAHRDYVARHGAPRSAGEIGAHQFVGFDRNTEIIDEMRGLGVEPTPGMFPVRCDSQLVNWALVRAGCGIGFGHRASGLADSNLVEVLPEVPMPVLPVWLTAHEAVRQTPRVARIWDLLATQLRPVLRAGVS